MTTNLKECYWSNKDFKTRICNIKLTPVTEEECRRCDMYKRRDSL